MGNANRGSKYGLYYVTRTSHYTSTLAECGFMSNNSEYKQLLDSATQQEMAQNLAQAIANYFSSIRVTGYQNGTESVGAVSQIPVTGVTLNKTELALAAGASETLTATVAPENATNKTVKWSTSDEKIATVDATGKVTAIAPGTATITATTEDGGKTAACQVTVTAAAIPVSGVSLNRPDLTLEVGASEVLSAAVAPENATNKNVKWTSSDTSVATVDGAGKVTAVKKGTATITATTEDGGKTAVCQVTVNDKPPAVVPVTGVTLDKTAHTLKAGETVALQATVTPENATNKNLSWSTSDSNFAKVDASGVVTAVAPGTATITASAGELSATCTITVEAEAPPPTPVTGVTLNQSSLSMVVGDSPVTLIATITPADAANQALTWGSDNEAVATVSGGTVTPVGAGTATITVTTVDGGHTATCTVTVVAAPPPEGGGGDVPVNPDPPPAETPPDTPPPAA